MSSRLPTLCALIALTACGLDNQGTDPPANVLNFPIAMVLARDPDSRPEDHTQWLVVANSNYTIHYNSGSLQTFDLNFLHSQIDAAQHMTPQQCVRGNACQLGTALDPQGSPLDAYIASEVGIGSHTADIALSQDHTRLYLAVRGDRNLTYVDFDPRSGELSCNAQPRVAGDQLPRCAPEFRSGTTTEASERNLTLKGDPVAVATGTLASIAGTPQAGDYVLMALRGGIAALFIDVDSGGTRRPELVHLLPGFQQQQVSIELERTTGLAWMASAISRDVGRVGIVFDGVNGRRSFLYDAGPIRLGGVDDGQDIRDLRFHPDTTIDRAFVLSRRPESVIGIDLDRHGLTPTDAALWRMFQLGTGPSRMVLAKIYERYYAFASCFDARKVYIIDIDRGELVSVIGGFSGPFALTVDESRNYLYVVDFSTSVLRLVNLDPDGVGRIGDELEITATVGDLRPVTQFGR